MERIIQPYGRGPSVPTVRAPGAPVTAPGHAAPPKSPVDYLRSLRRRGPLAALVALAVSSAGAAVVLRLPAMYQATAEIEITPPKFNETISVILDAPAAYSRDAMETYIPNRLAALRSKALIHRALVEVGTAPGLAGDPAVEVLAGLNVRPVPRTSVFQVTLEGPDGERVAKVLNALIETFKADSKDFNSREIEKSKQWAGDSLKRLRGDFDTIARQMTDLQLANPYLAADGTNLLQEEFAQVKSFLLSKRGRFDDLRHEKQLAEMFPNLRAHPKASPHDQAIAQLEDQRERFVDQLDRVRSMIVPSKFNTDPAVRMLRNQIAALDRKIQRLRELATPAEEGRRDLPSLALWRAGDDLRKLEREAGELKGRVLDSMLPSQQYLSLMKQREQKERSIAAMEEKLTRFGLAAESLPPPVVLIESAAEPQGPARPNRPLLIGLIVVLGIGLGIGLTGLLEYLDHRVRAPEHLTSGLTLPLYGVVPRMRRLARMHRGGHLWTPGAPESIEADAFRNLRASLLGGCGSEGRPIVTLLVTSAKAGEGKSTTALNLAATCARAGERTLLIDCDLRRPSLGEVFPNVDTSIGLVDVLQGVIPWQRAVVPSGEPHLNFLPAGDPAAVPIEVLGSLEMQQLIAAVAGHYHRVILDGPAVLGLADCRVLGRVVDAALLVVRAGAHDLRPLRRAKEMLEQSQVTIAGVVFNGMVDDLDNWSTNTPSVAPLAGPVDSVGRMDRVSRGLDAPPPATAATAAGRAGA